LVDADAGREAAITADWEASVQQLAALLMPRDSLR
jgi:hypothetical protein